MPLCLMLDENISPNISSALWTEGIDNYPVRDRGLLKASDSDLFARAQEEDRAIVTINASDFRRLARKAATHSGVVTIPSGGNRHEQLDYILSAIEWATQANAIVPSFRDHVLYVQEDFSVTAEEHRADPRSVATFDTGCNTG